MENEHSYQQNKKKQQNVVYRKNVGGGKTKESERAYGKVQILFVKQQPHLVGIAVGGGSAVLEIALQFPCLVNISRNLWRNKSAYISVGLGLTRNADGGGAGGDAIAELMD